jgi:hypothetical protein
MAWLLTVVLTAGEPLDRIAVSVGNRVITESALLLDLRITAFLNQAPLDFSPAAKRAEAQRLIDQILIAKEADESHLMLAGGDAEALLDVVRGRYSSEREYIGDLAKYGIRESDLIAHLQAGARTMAFSDLRFRPAARISDQELRSYYDGLVRERPTSSPPSFEASRAEIEELLRGQRALEALDEWLKAARSAVRIEFRENVFQ